MLDFNKLEQLNTDQLKRDNLGDSLNFRHINDSILNIKSKFLMFKNCNNNIFTNEDRNIISLSGNIFVDLCKEIIEFRHNEGEALITATANRNAIVNKFIEFKKQFNITVLPLIHEAMLRDEETQKKLNNLDQTIIEISKKNQTNDNIFSQSISSHNQRLIGMENEFKNKIQQIEQIKQRAESEANNVSSVLKDFSTEKLVGEYGEIFNKQAETNKKIATYSLVVLIFFGSALIWYAYEVFAPLIEMTLKSGNSISYGYLAVSLIFRLTILSIFFIAITESIKNFNVNMHLYNLNKHRQNALESFNVFKGLSNDSETRDCLIKEISSTIYSVNKIGYLSENNKATDFSQIIDLIKAIKP